MFFKKQQMALTLVAATLVGAGAAQAHHSFAMYDSEKTLTVEGTVKEFKWANPHVLLRVTGATADVAEQVWTLELTAPGQLSRNGWTHATLKEGDKVKVEFRPFRDGRPGGAFVNATLPDGTKVGR